MVLFNKFKFAYHKIIDKSKLNITIIINAIVDHNFIWIGLFEKWEFLVVKMKIEKNHANHFLNLCKIEVYKKWPV